MADVLLAPADAVTVNSGDTVQVVAYLQPGTTIATPAGWTAGRSDPAAVFGTQACALQEISIVAGAGFTWPTVTGSVVAWTWYVGQPSGPDAGYSWPQSATVTAA